MLGKSDAPDAPAPALAPPTNTAAPDDLARAKTGESSGDTIASACIPSPVPSDARTAVAVPTSPAKAPCCPRLTTAAHILTLALLALLATLHGWRANTVFAPSDATQLAPPFKPPNQTYIARNEQLLDQTVQFVPWMAYAVDRLRHGQVPLWNPHAGLGQPFLANGQSALFYPTTLLHLSLPETWSWTLSAFLRLFTAGLGAYCLARLYGLHGWPRLLPAVAFMLCGFNVVWLNHPQMNVMPWLPWAVLLTELLLARVTLPRVIAAPAIFAVQFLGGHPATSVHLLVTCGLVTIARLAWPRPSGADILVGPDPTVGAPQRLIVTRRPPLKNWLLGAAALAASLLLGFALAAAQWLPLIEYAEHSGAKTVRQAKLDAERLIATNPAYLIGPFFPYANGYAPDGVTPFEMRNATKLPNTNELAGGFVGTVPLVLAILAIAALVRRRTGARRDPSALLWAVVGLAAVLVAIKFPLVDHLVRKIPALNVSQNARLFGVVALALALLAGFGLATLIDRLRAGVDVAHLGKRLLQCAAAAALLAMVAAIAVWLLKGTIVTRGIAKAEGAYYAGDQLRENTIDHVHSLVYRIHTELQLTTFRLLIPTTLLAMAGLILLRAHRRAEPPPANDDVSPHPPIASSPPLLLSRAHFVPLALTLLTALDLLTFAIPFNPGSPAHTYPGAGAPPGAIARLKELPEARVAGTFRTMMPELATAYTLNDLRSYDALAPRRYFDFWSHPGLGNLAPEMQGYLSRLTTYDRPAWSLFNFAYLMTPPGQPAPDPAKWKPVYTGEDANLYQAATLRPRAWVAARAEVLPDAQDVFDRLADDEKWKGLAPYNQLVLLDGQVPADVLNATNTTPNPRVTVEFVGPRRPTDDDRPETVRVRVTGATGGWLVLADAFHPGWSATVVNDSNTGKDVPIYPAYGTLRAVPLPTTTARGGALTVEFTYRPWSWRIGAYTSTSAAVVLLLLITIAVFPRRRSSPVSQ
ncbi:MAG TPA: hypothetical protein VEA69_18120 [Tepidisphaeraceae bacterium]|nr:hypothetical protein [Tepidisphaeraceae bacterium]